MRAIFLISDDMARIDPSIRSSTYGPSKIPAANIPSKLGNLHFLQIQPSVMPTSRISAILSNIKHPPRLHNKKLTLSAFIAEVISFHQRF